MIVASQKQRTLDRGRGTEQALAPDREIQTRLENDCVAGWGYYSRAIFTASMTFAPTKPAVD
jgi:hypothetical protein